MKEQDKLSKYRSTIPKQIGKYIISQLLFIVVIAFLGSYLIFSLGGIWQKLSCGLLIFIYAISMYATTYEFACHDMKSFSRLNPYVWKGFAFGLIPAAVVAAEWAAYAYVWHGDGLTNAFEYIVNVLFVIGVFPYYAFVVPYKGYVMIYGISIAILLPIIISGLGYIAGMNNFDITAIFGRFMYEKKGKDRNNK